MDKWFNKQSRLVQLILLLIPFVGWIMEILVRWCAFFRGGKLLTLLFAIIVTVGGIVVQYIDLVWVLLFKHLIFSK